MITQEGQHKAIKSWLISVAQMVNARQFTYGMGGLFLFKIDLGLREGDSVCNACLIQQKEHIEAAKTVKCAQCSEFYQPVFDGDEQAWGCCAKVVERNGKLKVTCGYGSDYDCFVFDSASIERW